MRAREVPKRLREILELAKAAEVKISAAVALSHELPPEEREQVRAHLWNIRQHLRERLGRFGKYVEDKQDGPRREGRPWRGDE